MYIRHGPRKLLLLKVLSRRSRLLSTKASSGHGYGYHDSCGQFYEDRSTLCDMVQRCSAGDNESVSYEYSSCHV